MKFYFKKNAYFDNEYEDQLMAKDLERFNVKVHMLECAYCTTSEQPKRHEVTFFVSGSKMAYNKLKKAYKCTSTTYKESKMLVC